MFYILGKTYVSKLFQQRMTVLGVSRKGLKSWSWKNGFSRQEYVEVWENCWGSRISQEYFLVRLARRMGVDPIHVLLAAAADRAPTPHKSFFLAVLEGLERYPAVVRDWQVLDGETQRALLELVSQPQMARRWVAQYRTGTQAHPQGVRVRSR